MNTCVLSAVRFGTPVLGLGPLILLCWDPKFRFVCETALATLRRASRPPFLALAPLALQDSLSDAGPLMPVSLPCRPQPGFPSGLTARGEGVSAPSWCEWLHGSATNRIGHQVAHHAPVLSGLRAAMP